MPVINRTQALVLGFVGVSLAVLLLILLLAPEVYDAQLVPTGWQATKRSDSASSWRSRR